MSGATVEGQQQSPEGDRQGEAARRAAELGIEDPPDVEVIREISPDAAGLKVQTDCMIEKGYPYEYDSGGDVASIDLGLVDHEQFQLDTYIC